MLQHEEHPSESGASMLANEIMATVRRYSDESDVTLYQALGAMELVKAKLISMLHDAQPDED